MAALGPDCRRPGYPPFSSKRSPLAAETLIAIVDDDDLVRTSLAGLFRSFGIRTEMFSSATAFLSDDPDRFDIVVSDLQMPGMSGLDLARVLRERSTPPPVIIVTAYPERVASAPGLVRGLNLLEKPVDGVQLIACIERFTGRTFE